MAAAAVQKAAIGQPVYVISNNLALVINAIRLRNKGTGIVDGRIAAAAVQKAVRWAGAGSVVASNNLAIVVDACGNMGIGGTGIVDGRIVAAAVQETALVSTATTSVKSNTLA